MRLAFKRCSAVGRVFSQRKFSSTPLQDSSSELSPAVLGLSALTFSAAAFMVNFWTYFSAQNSQLSRDPVLFTSTPFSKAKETAAPKAAPSKGAVTSSTPSASSPAAPTPAVASAAAPVAAAAPESPAVNAPPEEETLGLENCHLFAYVRLHHVEAGCWGVVSRAVCACWRRHGISFCHEGHFGRRPKC